MTTEIRDYGDNKTIVVYSSDKDIVSKLRDSKSCLNIIAYEQEQYSNKKVAVVGYDFYFPKNQEKRLARLIK